MAKTPEEQVEELQKKMDQLKARQKQILARAKADERKKRTHRLIEIGGVVEKYCGEIDDMEAFEKYLQQYANAIKSYTKPNNFSE